MVVSDTTATDDQRGHSMSTTLEASEVADLPDDPDELEAYLTQLAGGAGAMSDKEGRFRFPYLRAARTSSASTPRASREWSAR